MEIKLPPDLGKIDPHIRYVNNYKPLYSYTEPERVIYDFELMYVMEGEVTIRYDQKDYHLKKSDLFYFRPGVGNAMTVEKEKHFRTHCIHFDWVPPAPENDFTAEEFYMHSILSPDHQERLEQLKKRPCPEPAGLSLPTHLQNMPYERFSLLFAKCYYAFLLRDAVSKLRLKSAFLELIAGLAEHCAPKQRARTLHPGIIYAIEYLKANYTRNLTAGQLAEKFGLSPKYFGTLFREGTGSTVSGFIQQMRIYAAKELLLCSDMTIGEIAERTGFQNQFYFAKCFKQQEKITPSGYRSLMGRTDL